MECVILKAWKDVLEMDHLQQKRFNEARVDFHFRVPLEQIRLNIFLKECEHDMWLESHGNRSL